MMSVNGKLRVLIDVDGVLRDFIGSLTSVYLRQHPGHTVKPVDSRELENFYPIGREIYPFMNQTFAREILVDAPIFAGVVDAMRQWESEFEYVIATAQPPEGRGPTLSWLGKHDIPTNEIHVCHKKHRLAGVALLDDFVDNLEAFAATERLAVCLDQPWNQHWKGPRVKTVEAFLRYVYSEFQDSDPAFPPDTRFA